MVGARLGTRCKAAGAAAFVGLLVLTAPSLAHGQDLELVTTLTHAQAPPGDMSRFGSGLAISGGTLFVGAKNEAGANEYSGAVHVFSDAGWSEVALLKSSVDSDMAFGSTIALDGDRALISNGAIDGGLVWFFEKDAGVWTEKLRIQGLVNEAFGHRLALRGDLAFIAAPRLGTGRVLVYRRQAGAWAEAQVLTADDAQEGDFFGYSVAFDGERLAVSAPGNFLGPTRTGVYTFSLAGEAFVQDGKLTGDDPASSWFGAAVGVSKGTLIVNAPPVYQSTSIGKALIYQRLGEQWTLERELSVEGEASFPDDLAFEGDTAWFGARTNEPRAFNAYAFQRTDEGWHAAQQLRFPDLGPSELTSWAFQGGTLAFGSSNGPNMDSVRVYRSADYRSPGGGATGSTNDAGSAAQGAAAAGVGASSSGGAAAAGPSSRSESSETGGCTFAPSQRSHTTPWELAALALAVAVTRQRSLRRG